MKSIHLLALAAILAAESVLFCVVTSHRYAWIYPRGFDQLQYLREGYVGYEAAQARGLAQGVRETLSQQSPQGALHGTLELLMFEAFGPSRIAALSLNLAAFLLLQGATFLAVRRISGSWPLSWAAIALLAALGSPWSGGTGSAVDFRLDWMAACAFGVSLAVAVAGRGFRSTPWALLFGAAVGAAILIRFISAVYFGVLFVVLLAWLLRQPDPRPRSWRLALSAIIASCLAGPALWNSRAAIYAYYWTWRHTGPERERFNSHMGLFSSVRWVFSELLNRQVGLAAAALGLGAAAALLAMGAIRSTRAQPAESPDTRLGEAWIVALAFFFAPAVVLILNVEKAFQTISILIPGAVWIIALAWIWLARRVSRRGVAAAGSAVALFGGLLFVGAETRKSYSDDEAAAFRAINGLNDYLFYRAEETGLVQPRIAVTWFLDSLNVGVLQVLGYERHHRLVPFLGMLPEGVLEPTKEDVMFDLANSDFVCLVSGAFVHWPYDHRMAEMLPDMRKWCDEKLRYVGYVNAGGYSVFVYERPGLDEPAGAGALKLAALVREASRGPDRCEAIPPGAPEFVSAQRVLGSTHDEFRYSLFAAFSPLRYGAPVLPEGLHLDPRTGELRGRFGRAGTFPARVMATNSAGSSAVDMTFQIEDARMLAEINAPKTCAAGAPVQLRYGAYDAYAKLDFIEITDLTDRRTLCRISVPEGCKRRWDGAYRLSFDRPGRRDIVVRTASYEPEKEMKYTFVDRLCEIEVSP